ncbi:hypothetical protein CDD83_1026 [Cordyceps sp. RAO-2017]|nr:hypothetical protein CDD83_1026 [Cordyceps sp. RAO-2017]
MLRRLRAVEPCLVHGDAWDGNCAADAVTGRAFVFDPCCFYGHNEYDTGNWRAPRHRLSRDAYIQAYQRLMPPSEPADEWEARNLLYSLPFNIANAAYIPGSTLRDVVYEDMKTLCELFCPTELEQRMRASDEDEDSAAANEK